VLLPRALKQVLRFRLCWPGVIDLHSHILPGVDDGVQTLEEARDLARRAAEDGVTAIAATPHVRADYPTTAARMEQGVEELRRDFAAHGINVEILRGGELDLERLGLIEEGELRRFTIAGGDQYLLLEFPYYGWPLALEPTIVSLRSRRLTAIVAHPERNADVQDRPERLEAAVDLGALIQVTAASVDGRLGQTSKRTAERLIELGLVHMIASDAHHPEIREAGLAAAAEAIGDPSLARYLTLEVPQAVVEGEPVERPPRRKRGRRRRMLPF
jgi:protein-tyrosine phosphatase